FSSRRRHTRFSRDWSSDVCSSDLIEGSSNNKALEIFNPTADTINLSTYKLHRFTNGATSSTSLNLSGNLLPFSTYVIANSSANRSEERRVGKECRSWMSKYH